MATGCRGRRTWQLRRTALESLNVETSLDEIMKWLRWRLDKADDKKSCCPIKRINCNVRRRYGMVVAMQFQLPVPLPSLAQVCSLR